jgi:type I restriction enzyme, S subunit
MENIMRDNVPIHWTISALSHVVDDYQSGFASGNKDVENGLFHLRMNNISNDGRLNLDLLRTVPTALARPYHYLQKGDLLICTTNSAKLVGKSAIFDKDGLYAFSNHLTRIRVRKEVVNSRYLFYYLFLLWQHGGYELLCKHWVNQSTLPKENLLSIEIPLAPPDEQDRVVNKLDVLLSKVNTCKYRLNRIPAILKRFRQSVLTAAYGGILTSDWRSSNPDIKPAAALLKEIEDERLSQATTAKERNRLQERFCSQEEKIESSRSETLPNTWLECTIGSIGDVQNGSTPSRKEPVYWNGKIPWVSSGEVRNNEMFSTREQISEEGFKHSSVRWLPPGTVLLAMIGEGKTRGQSAILRIKATINQNIAAVVIDHGLVLPKYLWYWLQYQYSQTRLVGSGSGPKALNCQLVRCMPLRLAPAEEQHEIVRRVEALFKIAADIEKRYEKARAHIDKLTQSILAKAFRGELVPQDPNDEPVSELLKSIQEERAPKEAKGGARSKKARHG